MRPSTDRNGTVQVDKKIQSSTLEAAQKEISTKFERLYQLIGELHSEHSTIREKMVQNVQELKADVDQLEDKHRKLEDILGKMRTCI